MNEKEMIEITEKAVRKDKEVSMADLLNQEQAELKKAMIEEMAEIIYENRPNKDIWIEDATEIAKVLLSAGYCKLPKGSVVLTEKEYNKLIERPLKAMGELTCEQIKSKRSKV